MTIGAKAADGTVRQAAGGPIVRFERVLPHPIAKVWAALTEPAGLAAWLAPGTIDLAPGGRARLEFTTTSHVVDGAVLAVDPPVLLEYAWGDHGTVRWELSPAAGGTRLVLTHALPEADAPPLFLAGWHTHLELLALALNGQPAPWPWPRWHEFHDRSAEATAGVRPRPGSTGTRATPETRRRSINAPEKEET